MHRHRSRSTRAQAHPPSALALDHQYMRSRNRKPSTDEELETIDAETAKLETELDMVNNWGRGANDFKCCAPRERNLTTRYLLGRETKPFRLPPQHTTLASSHHCSAPLASTQVTSYLDQAVERDDNRAIELGRAKLQVGALALSVCACW